MLISYLQSTWISRLIVVVTLFAAMSLPHLSAQDIRGADLEVRDVIMILAMTPEGANLEGLSFVKYDFSYLNFSKANLNRSILNGARLHDTIFIEASMMYTDLSGATLDGAILRGAKLVNASLSGASLEKTDLRGADLSGSDLSDTFIRSTVFDTTTIMPDGQPWNASMDLKQYTDRKNPNYIAPVGVDTPYTEDADLKDAVNKPTAN